MSYLDVIKALNDLSKTSVLVGIPADAKSRTASEWLNMTKGVAGITNAALGYMMETGSPAQNIPARPWLKPGVAESKSRWSPYLEQACQAALNGDTGVMERALNAAGNVAATAVKKKITAGIPPPIKPSTMAARARHRGGKTRQQRIKRAAERAAYRKFYAGYTKDTPVLSGGVTPLVDTAQMLNSITWVVGKAKS